MCRGSTPYCLLISSSSGTNSEYMTPATPSLFDKRPPGYAPDIYREKSRPEFCSGQAGFCVNAERQTASMSNKNAHDHSPVIRHEQGVPAHSLAVLAVPTFSVFLRNPDERLHTSSWLMPDGCH